MITKTTPSRNGREASVHNRYSASASRTEAALCCPVRYSRAYLKVIPEEIMQRDYGCGDPTPYVRSGETVLDLGAGGGKVCYILSQAVGPHGRVVGVDCNQEMIALARRYREEVAAQLGVQLPYEYQLTVSGKHIDAESDIDQSFGILDDPNNISGSIVSNYSLSLQSTSTDALWQPQPRWSHVECQLFS